jgi:hypothetical protein
MVQRFLPIGQSVSMQEIQEKFLRGKKPGGHGIRLAVRRNPVIGTGRHRSGITPLLILSHPRHL